MTFKPKFASVDPLAVAPDDAVAIEANDAFDVAVANAARRDLLVEYMRAKTLAGSLSGAFTSKAANLITPNANAALVEDAANMNGLDAFNLNPVTANPGFTSQVPCPASFTFITAIYLNSYRTLTQLLGVEGPEFAAYLNNTGKLVVDDFYGSGESPFAFAATAVPLTTRTLLWFSHDASSKTTRWGNGTTVTNSHVHTTGHAPDATSYIRPFGFYTGTGNTIPDGLVEGWTLFNHAYAGSGTGNDTYIAAAIAALQGLL